MYKVNFIKHLTTYYSTQSAGVNIYQTVDNTIFQPTNPDEINIQKRFARDFTNINSATFRSLNKKVLRKNIQNPPNVPWLDWIIEGKKTYEGRLNVGDWRTLRPEDIIIFYDQNNKSIKTVVSDLKYFKNFRMAFRSLGQQLVPIQGISEEEVENLYWKYFKQDDIDRYGVVAIGLKVKK